MTKTNKAPFKKSVEILMAGLGISMVDAIHRVDDYYKYFKANNNQLIQRQDDSANNAAINLINQCTLIATAVLTFAGAFIGVVYSKISVEQVLLFVIIAVCELISLSLALFEYQKTINFHNRWAKAYYAADQEIDKRFQDGSLQETDQLGKFQTKYTKDLPRETNKLSTKFMIICTIVGAWLFLFLVGTYFFDVPFYNAHSL